MYSTYIGRTVRRIETRFNEHLRDGIRALVEIQTYFVFDILPLLKESNDAWKLDYIDAVYINKYKNMKLMNKNMGKTSPLCGMNQTDERKRDGRYKRKCCVSFFISRVD